VYDRLIAPLRELLIGEVQEQIAEHPVFKDKTIVQHKFGTEEVDRYGVIFMGISTTDIKLDPSNYIGPLSSLVSKAKAGDNPGYSIEWVREDTRHLTDYIEEDVSSQFDGFTRKLQTANYPLTYPKDFSQPTVDSGKVVVEVNGYKTRLDSIDCETGEIYLRIPPLATDIVIVKYNYRRLVEKGVYQVEIINETEFLVSQLLFESYKDITTDDFKVLPHLFMAQYPFMFDFDVFHDGNLLIPNEDYYFSTTNKIVWFYTAFNTGVITVRLKDGSLLTAGQHYFYPKAVSGYVVADSAVGTESMFTFPQDFIIPASLKLTVNQAVIPSKEEWSRLKNFVNNNANLPVEKGVVKLSNKFDLYRYINVLRQPLIYELLYGNRIKFNQKLQSGDHIVASYGYYDTATAPEVQCSVLFGLTQTYTIPLNIIPGTLEVIRNKALQGINRDFTYDPATGTLFINKVLKSNDTLKVTYRHSGFVDEGPYTFKQNYVNTDALPGVVLAFGRRNQVGDKVMVMVNDKREVVADAYGGQWEVSLDLTIISDDPEQLGELTDYVHDMFKFNLRDRLMGEGIFIKDVSTGGDSEDEFHETGVNRFTASISLGLMTDWEAYRPIPFAIRHMDYSFEGDNLELGDEEMSRTRTQGVEVRTDPYVVVAGKHFEYLSTGPVENNN